MDLADQDTPVPLRRQGLRGAPQRSPAPKPSPPPAAAKRGSIVLARHGEPALSRKIRLNSEGYRRWWEAYEAGGILEDQSPPGELLDLARRADVIFASTRRRAVETAEAICDGKTFIRDPMFVEAPLPPPPAPRFLRFRPQIWGVVSRTLWWFFGHHGGQESRRQAEARARDAARQLVDAAEAGQEVLVLAHGFFNTMVGLELKKLGWRCAEKDRGFKYWATRRFESVREPT